MKDVLSQLFAAIRPHSRMRAQSSAYADGELAQKPRERFEMHLKRCAECARAVDAARELKTLLTALPMEDAPRPFRLTPQMVAVPARPARQSRNLAPLRFAQATATLAAFALLAVVTGGALDGGSSGSAVTAAADSALSANQSKAAAPRAAGATAGAGNQPQAAAASGSAAGGAQVADAPAPPRTGAERSVAGVSPPPTAGQPVTDGSTAYGAPEASRDSAPDQFRASTDTSAKNEADGRRWLEVSLLAVMLAAGAAWFGLSRNSRRRES